MKKLIVVLLLISCLGGLPTNAGKSADRQLDSSNHQQSKQSDSDDDPIQNRDSHIPDEQQHDKRVSQALGDKLQHASNTDNGHDAANRHDDRRGNLNEKTSSDESDDSNNSPDQDVVKEQQPNKLNSNIKSPPQSNNKDSHVYDEQQHDERVSHALSDKLQHASDTDNDDAANRHGDRRGNLNEKTSSDESDDQKNSPDQDVVKEQQPNKLNSNIKSPQPSKQRPFKLPDDKSLPKNDKISDDHPPKPKPDRHQPTEKQRQKTISKDHVKESDDHHHNHQVTKTKSISKTSYISKLSKAGDCDTDIKRFCAKKKNNILSLIICLQTEPRRVVSASFFIATTPIAYDIISFLTFHAV